MNRKLLLGGLLLLLVVGNASFLYIRSVCTPVNEPGIQPAPVLDATTLAAWHRQSKLPWKFDPATATYGEPRLGQALQLVDREIRKLAKPSWAKQAPAQYPFTKAGYSLGPNYCRTYEAFWNSGRDPGPNPQRSLLQHELHLELELIEAQPKVGEFRLRCQQLADDSWNISWHMHLLAQPLRLFFVELRVSHPEHCPDGISLKPGSQNFHFQEGNINSFRTILHLRNSSQDTYNRDTPATYIEFWKSPDSLQTAFNPELDSFELAIGNWFAAGGPVMRFRPPPGDGSAPEPLINPQFLKLGLRLQLAVTAGTGNFVNRCVVQKHAAEIQQALNESFPALPELLQLLQTPQL